MRPGRDHPRVRGEHRYWRDLHETYEGSSPRARGARISAAATTCADGIIPACAGSTRPRSASTSPPRDHPRVRGEHSVMRHRLSQHGGSSPRARGARTQRLSGRCRAGIIPACAGSTRHRLRSPDAAWDHPRVRGEHPIYRGKGTGRVGSSPRARGARHPVLDEEPRAGIIPACAGSTAPTRTIRGRAGDHPRVRGEHRTDPDDPRPGRGSSPRARGAQQHPGGPDRLMGIIPACAGSTTACAALAVVWRDHPRVRGEHCSTVRAWGSMLGSSPRARGARAHLRY